MRKLTANEVKVLRNFKGVENGPMKFFDMIEEIYKENEEILNEIGKCREMCKSVDAIDSWPAREKTRNMFYSYMDDLLEKIGYEAE